MPHRSTLVLVLALAAVVRAIPVDEISARNGIGGQADPISAAARNCTSSLADCNMSEFSGMSLLKIAPENAGRLTSLSTALGSGGETPDDNHLALIELDSDNVGHGGGVSSGNSSGLVN